MKKLLCISIAVLFYFNAFSQSYGNIWVFGDSSGLDINEDMAFKSSINTHEACASIADSLGNLLFYTNGEKVWNRNNEIMPDGTDLNIGQLQFDFHSSITQGTIILRKPEASNLYYIISIVDTGVVYSLVDMQSDDDDGDVIEKNTKFNSDFLTENMQLVKHANGRDWWLLLHTFPKNPFAPTSEFYFISYLIKPDSILGPLYQDYGPDYDPDIIYIGQGQMKISMNGDRLAYLLRDHLHIFSFDRCEGKLFDWIEISDVDDKGLYGCEFSPDGSKIYVASNRDGNESTIYQYDLTATEPIVDTKQIIYRNTHDDYCIAQLQLTANGKIYVSQPRTTIPNDVYSFLNKHLSVINKPNDVGEFCDFDTLTISLGDSRSTYALPNMPNYNLGALAGSECDTIVAINNISSNKVEIKIYPNPANINIYIKTYINEVFSYQLKTITGEKIAEGSFTKEETIDIKDFSKGAYIIDIKNNQNKLIKTQKIFFQ